METCAYESIVAFESVVYKIENKNAIDVRCYPEPVITFNYKNLESPSAKLKYSGKIVDIIHSSIYSTQASSIEIEAIEILRKINYFGLGVAEYSFYSTTIARLNSEEQAVLIYGENGTLLFVGHNKNYKYVWGSRLSGWQIKYKSSHFYVVRKNKWIGVDSIQR